MTDTNRALLEPGITCHLLAFVYHAKRRRLRGIAKDLNNKNVFLYKEIKLAIAIT